MNELNTLELKEAIYNYGVVSDNEGGRYIGYTSDPEAFLYVDRYGVSKWIYPDKD